MDMTMHRLVKTNQNVGIKFMLLFWALLTIPPISVLGLKVVSAG
jgi:hypothetical protein